MKTVLMILPEFGYGGAEKSFCALSTELAKTYNVKIVVFNSLIPPLYPIGGDVISLDLNASSTWVSKAFNFFRRTQRLRKIKKNLRPDVSISFLEGANYINALSSNYGRTIISARGSKVHDQNINSSFGLIRKRILTPYLYAKADTIICLSNGIKEELLNTYTPLKESKLKVIYNPIDINYLTTKSNEPINPEWDSIFENHKTLVISARMAIEKGIHLFLPVFADLVSKNKALRLIIIGDGSYLPDLKSVCDRLALKWYDNVSNISPDDKQVYFLGYQQNPFKWIRRANLFISSSIHEGFGNSILEALALGIPVLSSDCPYGPREILAPDSGAINTLDKRYPIETPNGILLPLIDHNTKELWIHEILTRLENTSWQASTQMRAKDRAAQFSIESFREQWINIIQSGQILNPNSNYTN